MEETQVVKDAAVTGSAESELVKTQSVEKEQKQAEVVDKPAQSVIQAGDKTDPNLLLESLKKEREKRRLLEEELQTLKSSTSSEDIFSDEGKALKNQISTLEARVALAEEEKNLEKLYSQFPVLRDKAEEFNTFRQAEHPRAKMESVAKLFLVENGLLDAPRKGLEKPTGGQRTPSTSGMTADDVKTLRQTNFKKYQEMIMKGQIKID